MTEPSILFRGFIIRMTPLLQADFHKSSFSHKLKGKKWSFENLWPTLLRDSSTLVQLPDPKTESHQPMGLLAGDYFILLHYSIISWVRAVLHASLYSALLSTVTLNSVQTGIAARPVHTGTDYLDHPSSSCMQIHVPMGTTWGTPALATLSSKKLEVQLGVSSQGGAGRKPWGAHTSCWLISPLHLCLRAETAFMSYPLQPLIIFG